MRSPPEPLYSTVFDLAAAITNASEASDSKAEAEALEELRAYYRSRSDSSQADPFLTETLADYECDPFIRLELYRLSLSQAPSFPGEPLYTKRIGMAECLIEVGNPGEAKAQLQLARPEAEDAADEFQISYIAELLSRVAVQPSVGADRER